MYSTPDIFWGVFLFLFFLSMIILREFSMNKIISLMLIGFEMVVHVRMTKLPSQIHNAFVKYHYLLNIQSDNNKIRSKSSIPGHYVYMCR